MLKKFIEIARGCLTATIKEFLEVMNSYVMILLVQEVLMEMDSAEQNNSYNFTLRYTQFEKHLLINIDSYDQC